MASIETTIEEEKSYGLYWLNILNSNFPTILAGGAPRDWYRNVQCTDMDFFIKAPCTKEEIELAIGLPVTALENEAYPTHQFEGYEVEVDGYKLQFLVHEYEDAEEFVSSFPVGLSQCWYDLSGFHSTRLFRISQTYKLITITPVEEINWGYVDKICGKFFGYHMVDSRRMLRVVGRLYRPGREPAVAWVDDAIPFDDNF